MAPLAAAPSRLVAVAAPLAFVLLWSSAFIAVRGGLPFITPLYFLALRFIIAAAVLLGLCAVLRPTRRAWRTLAGRWHHFAYVARNALEELGDPNTAEPAANVGAIAVSSLP